MPTSKRPSDRGRGEQGSISREKPWKCLQNRLLKKEKKKDYRGREEPQGHRQTPCIKRTMTQPSSRRKGSQYNKYLIDCPRKNPVNPKYCSEPGVAAVMDNDVRMR